MERTVGIRTQEVHPRIAAELAGCTPHDVGLGRVGIRHLAVAKARPEGKLKGARDVARVQNASLDFVFFTSKENKARSIYVHGVAEARSGEQERLEKDRWVSQKIDLSAGTDSREREEGKARRRAGTRGQRDVPLVEGGARKSVSSAGGADGREPLRLRCVHKRGDDDAGVRRAAAPDTLAREGSSFDLCACASSRRTQPVGDPIYIYTDVFVRAYVDLEAKEVVCGRGGGMWMRGWRAEASLVCDARVGRVGGGARLDVWWVDEAPEAGSAANRARSRERRGRVLRRGRERGSIRVWSEQGDWIPYRCQQNERTYIIIKEYHDAVKLEWEKANGKMGRARRLRKHEGGRRGPRHHRRHTSIPICLRFTRTDTKGVPPSSAHGVPAASITIECQAGLTALNAVIEVDAEDGRSVGAPETTLPVSRDGVDIRLPFFRDLLADKPVPGANEIRSLAEWSGDGSVEIQKAKSSAGKKFWDGEAEKLKF
ncbi:hypothetical protein C8R45DRAFT_936415 [Mycena sanguinolenta]|nr:hypothetical protein C8R45DRAFT_936415 [Mycena sanguinolenta]